MDYLETDSGVDAKRLHPRVSRLGKRCCGPARTIALRHGIASCSGEGGASLSRRNYGETVKNLNTRFVTSFAQLSEVRRPRDQMPWSPHASALIAPRPLYLQTR